MSNTRDSLIRVAAALAMMVSSASYAVDLGQVDDFEDGTTQGWSEGNQSPNPPVNVATGGPDGAGDNYLSNTSGGAGSGSRMIMFNNGSWTGDYVTDDINFIQMHVRVAPGSDGPISLRVGFQNGTTQFVSNEPTEIPDDGNWYLVALPIGEGEMTRVQGTGSYAATMGAVDEMRILHQPTQPAWRGATIVATMDVDNITARSGEIFEGWLWERTAGNSPAVPELEEDYCSGQLFFLILEDDTWMAQSVDEVCWGRLTENTSPPRSYINFDGASYLSTESISTQSTQPLVNAGGNLLELYGQSFENGVGEGESRLGTIVAAGNGDLLMYGAYESFSDPNYVEAADSIIFMAKSTKSVKDQRTASDVEGRWRFSFLNQGPSRGNVNAELALGTIATVDLESGGACTYSVSSVFQDASFDTNNEVFFGLQFDTDGVDLGNRTVQGATSDRTVSDCTYEIDNDGFLALSFTRTTGGGPSAISFRRVVSDQNNYLVVAPGTSGVDSNPTSLTLDFRAPSALVPSDIDGNYLIYLTVSEFIASGSGHSQFETDVQEFDQQGRGIISFDSTNPGTVPAGQVGNWFTCDVDLITSYAETRLSGEPGQGTLGTQLELGNETVPFTGCDYNVLADGSLLVNFTVQDPGEPPEEILFAGYANHNGEMVMLYDFQTDPDPFDPGLTEDFASLRHVVGMRYTGNPDGDQDGDGFTNLEEFQLPLPPPETEPLLLRRTTDNRWFNYLLNGTQIIDQGRLEMTRSPDYSVMSRADFDGDGKPDLLVRDTVGGENGRWVLYTLDGMEITSQGFADLTRNADWVFTAAEDFNGDGNADVLLRNSVNGRWLLYLMNGQNIIGQGQLSAMTNDLNDTFQATGDVDRDGDQDVLIRQADNQWRVYLMNGLTNPTSTFPSMTTNPNFTLRSMADHDADGDADILLRRNDGRWFMYLLENGNVIESGAMAMTENIGFIYQDSADFDGDGASDVLIRRFDGRWFMYTLNGLTVTDFGSPNFTRNLNFEIVSLRDYNADGNADVLLRRDDGRWVLYMMDGPVRIDFGVPDMTRNTEWVPYPH